MYNKEINSRVLLAILILATCFVACKKEGALTPGTVFDGGIKLPQGWSKFDTSIKNFYDSTGTYIGYKFDNEADLRFFMTGIPNTPLQVPPPVLAVQVDSSSQGDIDTLNMAVDYVINGLLRSSYSNKLLRQLLPYKILLYKYGRQLSPNQINKPKTLTGFDTTAISLSINAVPTTTNNMAEGFNCIGLGIVRKTSSYSLPTGYSPSQKQAFYQFLWVGPSIISGAVARKKIPVPPDFNITDYGTLVNLWTNLPQPRSNLTVDSLCKASGVMMYSSNVTLDYAYFIRYISLNTRDMFDANYLGVNDPNGLRRRKRDAIVTFFKNEYNYDIENAWNK